MEQVLLLHFDDLLVLCRENRFGGRGFRKRMKIAKPEYLARSRD